MSTVTAVFMLSILAAAKAGTQFLPTDQSRHNQLDEINSFIQYFIESLEVEINSYESLGYEDKELHPYIDSMTVIKKLVKHNWLRNMKPGSQYSVPSGILQQQQAIDDLAEDLKQMDRTTPVADAILLFNKVDTESLLNDRKQSILFSLKSLEGSIVKAKQAEDFDKADTLRMWRSKLLDQLISLETDIKQSAILNEMILQSYIINFNPRRDGKTVTIRHSDSLVEGQRDFPMPPLDTLSVLQEIDRNFK